MWEEFLTFLKASVLPALALIITALAGWGIQQIEVLKKKSKSKYTLQLMKENSAAAVKAVDQMYPDEVKEVKKKLALEMAQILNKEGGIENSSEQVQLILNESNVLTLPRKENEKQNVSKVETGVG
jgi:hypothetical protein